MSQPMTPQERAADVIETWKTYDPTGFRIGHLTQLIEGAIKQTRRAALLEAAKLVGDYNCMHNHGKGAPKVYDDVFDELQRLAQEG